MKKKTTMMTIRTELPQSAVLENLASELGVRIVNYDKNEEGANVSRRFRRGRAEHLAERVVGCDADRRCNEKDVYCHAIAGVKRAHYDPGMALEEHARTLAVAARKVASDVEQAAASRPLSRYRDPVLRGFIRWSASALRALAHDMEEILSASRQGDATEALHLVEEVRYERIDYLAFCKDYARAQSRQRSGDRKAAWVKSIYDTIEQTFEECARIDEVGYLVEWIGRGIRPEDALRKRCARWDAVGRANVH